MREVETITLGAFLRRCRERLTPAAVGLPNGGRRRVRGLRRDEVAQLASVSVEWYTRLEQDRPDGHPSRRVLADLARALRLSRFEEQTALPARRPRLGDDDAARDGDRG